MKRQAAWGMGNHILRNFPVLACGENLDKFFIFIIRILKDADDIYSIRVLEYLSFLKKYAMVFQHTNDQQKPIFIY